MAYLTDRAYDVFISYAHADDDPSHWVRQFARHLEKELERQLRIKESSTETIDVTVWKDNQLPQQGNLSNRLQSVIKESSIFLVIMSNSYLLSEWCKEESKMFVNSLKDKSDLRIFIVEKEKTDKGKWPELLKTEGGKRLLSRPFYEEVDVEQTETIPLITPQGSADPRATRIMEKFCHDLSTQLYEFEHFPRLDRRDQTKNVFLAISPEGKARNHRSKLASLIGNWEDISILPSPEPKTPEEFKESLAKQLPQCDLFVQVLDELQGLYLSRDPKGFVGHQFDEAVNQNKKILHWKDPALNLESLEDGPYEQFLSELNPRQSGGTVVSGTLEEFAQTIHDVPDQPKRPRKTKIRVCFVAVKSDIQDQENAKDVGEAITTVKSDIDIQAILLKPGIKAKEIDDLMAFSKGIVIVWGEVGGQWILGQIDSFNEVAKQDDKVRALAICDPYPKGFELVGNVKSISLWSQADPAKTEADVENFVRELQRVMSGG